MAYQAVALGRTISAWLNSHAGSHAGCLQRMREDLAVKQVMDSNPAASHPL